MHIRPPIIEESSTSSNIHHSDGVFTPMDDKPFHIIFPVNPGWIPESFDSKWVLTMTIDSPGPVTLTLSDANRVESPFNKNIPPHLRNDQPPPILASFQVFGKFSHRFENTIKTRHMIVEGSNMADYPLRMNIEFTHDGHKPISLPMRFRDYPRIPLDRRFERELTTEEGGSILFRMKAEKCSDRDLNEAMDDAEALEASGYKILNHPRHFLKHNPKDSTFRIWRSMGLPTPDWINADKWGGEQFDFMERHDVCLYRINDDACSRNTHIVSKSEPIPQGIIDHIAKLVKEGRSWTRSMLVEKIQPVDDRLILARTFVANGKVICTVPLFSHAKPDVFSQWPATTVEDTLRDCRTCEQFQTGHIMELASACMAVGLDFAALDILLTVDGSWVLLEANGYWGMGAGILWPYNHKIRDELVEMDGRGELEELPSLRLRLDEWKFWISIYTHQR